MEFGAERTNCACLSRARWSPHEGRVAAEPAFHCSDLLGVEVRQRDLERRTGGRLLAEQARASRILGLGEAFDSVDQRA